MRSHRSATVLSRETSVTVAPETRAAPRALARRPRLSEDSAVVIPDGATLRKAVDTLKGQNLLGEDADVKGDLFEILVNDLGSQKKAAQFRTPPCGLPVKRGMGDRLKPSQWKFLQSGMIHIFEADKDIIRMAAMNSVLHGFDQSPIVPCDSIGGGEDKWDEVQFDCILENPPFSGTVQSPNGVVNRATQAERFSQGTSGKSAARSVRSLAKSPLAVR